MKNSNYTLPLQFFIWLAFYLPLTFSDVIPPCVKLCSLLLPVSPHGASPPYESDAAGATCDVIQCYWSKSEGGQMAWKKLVLLKRPSTIIGRRVGDKRAWLLHQWVSFKTFPTQTHFLCFAAKWFERIIGHGEKIEFTFILMGRKEPLSVT